jgi:hypothetical protein
MAACTDGFIIQNPGLSLEAGQIYRLLAQRAGYFKKKICS